MALVVADRVKETTTTTGTGTLTLAGAATGFQSFAVIGNGNTTYYTITDSATGDWEVGIGTYTASGTTLARTTVLSSSNGNALVPFGAGSKDVFVTYPAEYASTEQVGDVKIATSAPTGPGTWLETGKYYSKAAYPALASVVGDVPDLGSNVAEPQARLPTPFAASSSAPYSVASDGTTTVIVGSSGTIRKTTDGITWNPVISPTTGSINQCRYLNGNFIATTQTTTILVSTDGTNWAARRGIQQGSSFGGYYSIAFGNGTYVAVGGQNGVASTIAYSTNLNDWQLVPIIGSSVFTQVIYANSLFVAVGNNGLCYTSSDGITWTSRSAGSNSFTDVIYANGLFVAVGLSGALYTSPDGVTWTSRSAGSANFNQVIYENSLFVVVGTVGTIYTSSDGVTWTSRTSNTVQSFGCIVWNGTNYFAGAFFGGVYATSSDGITWTANADISVGSFSAAAVVNGKTILFGNNSASVIVAGASRTEVLQTGTWGYSVFATSAPNPRTIAYNGSNQYVAVGSSSVILTSSDAQTWAIQKSPVSTNFDKVQYLNGNYIAMGGSGSATNLLTSPDGTTWTARTAGTAIFNAAAYGASVYVVVGASGAVFSSPDLATWTTRSAGANTFNDVIFANSIFVAIGASNSVYSSTDGATWTLRTATGTWNRIIYANSLFVIVGNSGAIATSSDGITWTTRTSGVSGTLNDVAWNGSIYCAVGASGVITTSTNGTTWTARTPGDSNPNLMSISWSGTRFVVTNSTNGPAWVSTDGITWTRVATVFNAAVRYSAYLGGRFVAIGSGFIQSSSDGLVWKNCDHVQYAPTTASRLYKLGSYYYAATNSGLFQSSDGITFSLASREIPSGQIVALAYSGSVWVVVANTTGSIQPPIVYTSNNGTTWTKSAEFGTATGSGTFTANDLVYAGSNFIISTGFTGIQTSSDGITWTSRVLPYGASAPNAPMASDGSTAIVQLTGAVTGMAKSTNGGATWTPLYIGAVANSSTPIYSSGVWLISNYLTTDLINFNTTISSFASGVYVYSSKYAYNVSSINTRLFASINSASAFSYIFNTNVGIPTISGGTKEYPQRGSTLLIPANANSSGSIYAILEVGLYGYDTATTFWVPPQLAGGGQTAYIYAGP